MDGVLIDTEPVWRDVEIAEFARAGATITEEDCRNTMGLRIDEVVQQWARRWPYLALQPDALVEGIVDGMVDRVRSAGAPMPGALEALRLVREAGLRCAVASSSPLRLIEAVLDRLGLRDAVDVRCSAEHEARGKPAPEVYLTTAAALGVPASACLAVEDSPNGVLAAAAAGMPCVAIPDAAVIDDPRLGAAVARLGSLCELDRPMLNRLAAAHFGAGYLL